MKVEDAETMLVASKLKAIVVKSESSYPIGQVTSVTPYVGDIVRENYTVTLNVSSGAGKVVVPSVINETLTDAQFTLGNVKLIEGNVEHENDNGIKGQIMQQTPTAGKSADAGSSVDLVISDGPLIRMLTVPDISLLTKAVALQVLKKSNIKFALNYDTNENYDNNVVTAQSVKGGDQMPQNETLYVTINRISNQNQSITTPTGVQNNPTNTVPQNSNSTPTPTSTPTLP